MEIIIAIQTHIPTIEDINSAMENLILRGKTTYSEGKVIEIENIIIEPTKDNIRSDEAEKNSSISPVFRRVAIEAKSTPITTHVFNQFIQKQSWLLLPQLDQNYILLIHTCMFKKMISKFGNNNNLTELRGEYQKSVLYKSINGQLTVVDEGID